MVRFTMRSGLSILAGLALGLLSVGCGGGSSAPPSPALEAPNNLNYGSNTFTFTANTPISSVTPTWGGGQPTSFVVQSGTLPSGLSIDPTHGVLSGTPSVPAAQSSCTVRASNAAGHADQTLTITVNAAPTSTLTYTTSPAVYTVSVAITNNTLTSTTPNTVYTVNPQLPAGLSIDQQQGFISGTPSSAAALGSYTVTATSSPGGVVTATGTVIITVNPVPTWGQFVVDAGNDNFVADPAVALTYTAVGAGPFTRQLRAKIQGSENIFLGTNAYINFNTQNPNVTLQPGGSSVQQCQVTSVAPECDVVAYFPAGVTSTEILVTVSGAVTTLGPPYQTITITATPDTTPTPGNISLVSQGTSIPVGFKAPLWVVWKNPGVIGVSPLVTLNIEGSGASFYWFPPGTNSLSGVLTGATTTCQLNFDGSAAGNVLQCGVGLYAPAGTTPGPITVNAVVSGAGTYTYPVTPLSLAVVSPEPTIRTVTFTNQSSKKIWVGITGGGGNSFLDPITPVGGLVSPTSAQNTPGAGSACGPSNLAAACPIGTTCVQGGAAPSSDITQTPFYCYYDQPVPVASSPGASSPYEIDAGESTVLAISGSSISSQGIVWSGNFYARTGCQSDGTCENAQCVGTDGGLACGLGTGGAPGVNTLAEVTFQSSPAPGQPAPPDYYDVSIINGANFAVQFGPGMAPSPTSSPYTCGTAGASAPQVGSITLPGSPWTVGLSSASFPTGAVLSGDVTTYFRMVLPGPTSAGPCTVDVSQNGQQGCTGTDVCGFDIGALNGNFDGTSRVCGKMLSWITADSQWGVNKTATNLSPFNFNQPFNVVVSGQPTTVSVGDLQLCINNSYSSYIINWNTAVSPPTPVQDVGLACGGVMWGATEYPGPNQNPATNTGKNMTVPTTTVQTANTNWLQYVLPTILWLKNACPTCYTFPFDDPTSTFQCSNAGGAIQYTVTFSDFQ